MSFKEGKLPENLSCFGIAASTCDTRFALPVIAFQLFIYSRSIRQTAQL